MIPCHYAPSPNDSVAHSNGLDSEWFGNRFRIHTESFSFRMTPKLTSGTSESYIFHQSKRRHRISNPLDLPLNRSITVMNYTSFTNLSRIDLWNKKHKKKTSRKLSVHSSLILLCSLCIYLYIYNIHIITFIHGFVSYNNLWLHSSYV